MGVWQNQWRTADGGSGGTKQHKQDNLSAHIEAIGVKKIGALTELGASRLVQEAFTEEKLLVRTSQDPLPLFSDFSIFNGRYLHDYSADLPAKKLTETVVVCTDGMSSMPDISELLRHQQRRLFAASTAAMTWRKATTQIGLYLRQC